jgi:hypothetical protein
LWKEAALAEPEWRRIAGFRVVFTSGGGMYPPPRPPVNWRARLAGMAAVLLIVGGAAAVGVAALTQRHAPQPGRGAAGATAASARGPRLPRSEPVAVSIPAIGVRSSLLHLGLNADGTIQVPSVYNRPMEAAWYKYSVTPGQIGSSVIEGHVDTLQGPAVFFRLGALRPGNSIAVTLANGVTAVFRVTGVREYAKDDFPTKTIYGASHYAELHLITCGGAFDFSTGHYLSSTVVFASLVSSRR